MEQVFKERNCLENKKNKKTNGGEKNKRMQMIRGVRRQQSLKLATVSDDDLGRAFAAAASFSFNSLDDFKTLDDLPKHDMLAIEPVCGQKTDAGAT